MPTFAAQSKFNYYDIGRDKLDLSALKAIDMERFGISPNTRVPLCDYSALNPPLTKEDLLADEQLVQDLKLIAQQTWMFLIEHLDKSTSLPIDRVDVNGSEKITLSLTSPTNIGLALISLGMAEDLSLTDQKKIRAIAAKMIDTLQNLERKLGLFLNWYHTESGETIERWPGAEGDLDPFLSSVDNAWMAAGLLYAQEKFPSLAAQIEPMLEAMNFSLFHNSELNSFSGGYFPETQKLAKWQYDLRYLSESRVLYYVSYLLKQINKQQLQELFDRFPTHTFGGSAFEALMPGLIFDEGPVAEEAVKTIILSQIDAGKTHGAWGFTPCVDAGGKYKNYGTGHYADNGFDVVALHAIFLALEHNPNLTLPVLTKLINELDIWSEYGFYDSVDVNQGISSKTLLYLDQAMIFLALGNLLNGNSVRKTFTNLIADTGYE